MDHVICEAASASNYVATTAVHGADRASRIRSRPAPPRASRERLENRELGKPDAARRRGSCHMRSRFSLGELLCHHFWRLEMPSSKARQMPRSKLLSGCWDEVKRSNSAWRKVVAFRRSRPGLVQTLHCCLAAGLPRKAAAFRRSQNGIRSAGGQYCWMGAVNPILIAASNLTLDVMFP